VDDVESQAIRLRAEVAGLKRAMESRATIEQAKGILMAVEHCSPGAAFDILTRASQRQNRKLALVAAEIVERTSQPCEPAVPGAWVRHPSSA
jgi:AmiR/NasT family two-component response regulator